MYNVGFGDCFLLFVPTSNGVRKIVIDCGSIKKKSRELREIAASLIDDCRDPDGKARIDILIASHRHLDHITGLCTPTGRKSKWVKSGCRGSNCRTIRVRWRSATLRQVGRRARAGGVAARASRNCRHRAECPVHRRWPQGAACGLRFESGAALLSAGDGVVEKIESTLLPGIDVFGLGPPNNRQALKDDTAPPGQTLLTGLLAAEDDDDEDKFQPLTRDWIEDNLALEDRLRDEAGFQDAVSRIAAYKLLAAKLDAEINNTSLILDLSDRRGLSAVSRRCAVGTVGVRAR